MSKKKVISGCVIIALAVLVAIHEDLSLTKIIAAFIGSGLGMCLLWVMDAIWRRF